MSIYQTFLYFEILQQSMTEYHFIKDRKLREMLQVIGAVIGLVGVVIAILSFIY